MPLEQWLSLAGFVLVMVGTPGPNNLMLMASGVNFGVQRSLPHLSGVAFGCQILLVVAALGLGQLMALHPAANTVMQVLSALFLCYMAWLLVASRPEPQDGSRGEHAPDARAAHPMSFWQATLFQWVNPKAWLITTVLVATYTDPAQMLESTARASLAFLVVGTPLLFFWNAAGQLLQQWIREGQRLLWFNRSMAVLLLGSLYPLVA